MTGLEVTVLDKARVKVPIRYIGVLGNQVRNINTNLLIFTFIINVIVVNILDFVSYRSYTYHYQWTVGSDYAIWFFF